MDINNINGLNEAFAQFNVAGQRRDQDLQERIQEVFNGQQAEINRLQAENGGFQGRVADLGAENIGLNRRIAELQAVIDGLQGRVRELEAQVGDLHVEEAIEEEIEEEDGQPDPNLGVAQRAMNEATVIAAQMGNLTVANAIGRLDNLIAEAEGNNPGARLLQQILLPYAGPVNDGHEIMVPTAFNLFLNGQLNPNQEELHREGNGHPILDLQGVQRTIGEASRIAVEYGNLMVPNAFRRLELLLSAEEDNSGARLLQQILRSHGGRLDRRYGIKVPTAINRFLNGANR